MEPMGRPSPIPSNLLESLQVTLLESVKGVGMEPLVPSIQRIRSISVQVRGSTGRRIWISKRRIYQSHQNPPKYHFLHPKASVSSTRDRFMTGRERIDRDVIVIQLLLFHSLSIIYAVSIFSLVQ